MASADTYKSCYLLVRLRLITNAFLFLRDVLTCVHINQAILTGQHRLACGEAGLGRSVPGPPASHRMDACGNQAAWSPNPGGSTAPRARLPESNDWLLAGITTQAPWRRGFDLPPIHWDSWNFMGRWQGFRELNANGCWLSNSNSNRKALPAHKKKTLVCKSGNVDFLIWMH